MGCEHNSISGDNYGSTCNDCGEQITGMGENARDGSANCIHEFYEGMCIYCEASA